MRRVSQQIGWSQESKLYYQVLKQLEELTNIYGTMIPTTTTTTTGLSANDITIPLSPYEGFFDVTSGFSATIGWWMKMYNDTGFPRVFSLGQYPTAYLAVSIESDSFYLWCQGSILGSFPMPTYLNQWIFVYLYFNGSGGADVYIDGNLMGSFSTVPVVLPSNTLYIGSENAPNTYIHGLMRDFVWDAGAGLSPIPPIVPQVPSFGALDVFNGTDLATQLTDTALGLTLINNGVTYNSDSPYVGYPGSVQF